MISNSYRILDKKRVSHEDLHKPYPAPEGPTFRLPPTGLERPGKAPISVSMNLQDGAPKARFLTVADTEEGTGPGGLVSLEFGRHQSKCLKFTKVNNIIISPLL